MADDLYAIVCPSCGEQVDVYLEPDVRGVLIYDCEVCCNPWQLRLVREAGERRLEVARADGSE